MSSFLKPIHGFVFQSIKRRPRTLAELTEEIGIRFRSESVGEDGYLVAQSAVSLLLVLGLVKTCEGRNDLFEVAPPGSPTLLKGKNCLVDF